MPCARPRSRQVCRRALGVNLLLQEGLRVHLGEPGGPQILCNLALGAAPMAAVVRGAHMAVIEVNPGRGGAMSIAQARRVLYKVARLLGDINAIEKPAVPRRVERRIAGKVTGRLLGRLFRCVLVVSLPLRGACSTIRDTARTVRIAPVAVFTWSMDQVAPLPEGAGSGPTETAPIDYYDRMSTGRVRRGAFEMKVWELLE